MEPFSREQDPAFLNHLKEAMRLLSDAELEEVLRKRQQYQPAAAEEAVREALLRGLIRDEEELKGNRFAEKKARFTLFPSPANGAAADKLFRSLLRSLLLIGIIPAAFGVLKFTQSRYPEGAGLVSLGMVWIGIAWLVMIKKEVVLLWPLLVLALISLAYVARVLSFYRYLSWSDYLIAIVLYAALFYLLFYARAVVRRLKITG